MVYLLPEVFRSSTTCGLLLTMFLICSTPMSITAHQSRMARAALGWSIRETAAKAQLGTNTLARFEGGGEAYISTAEALRAAYEAAGITFIAAGASSLDGGAGIRLAKVEA